MGRGPRKTKKGPVEKEKKTRSRMKKKARGKKEDVDGTRPHKRPQQALRCRAKKKTKTGRFAGGMVAAGKKKHKGIKRTG